MVRILPLMTADYATYNNAAIADAVKRPTLTNRLDTIIGTQTLEDVIYSGSFDYYWAQNTRGQARVSDPGDLDQANGHVTVLRQIASGAQAFNAATVINHLEAVDAILVNWYISIANFGGGWRSGANRLYPLTRITQYPGLQRSFGDVRAGLQANAAGVPYNPHPFQNNPGVLPYLATYTTFDWIQNDNNRGPKRGIFGVDNSLYVTDDHYQTFERILATGTNPIIAVPAPFIAS